MGIGSVMAVAECESVAGPTDATITTEEPCDDVLDDCADLAEDSCYESWVATDCPKSCGLCSGKKLEIYVVTQMVKDNCYSALRLPGATPVASNTCYDLWSNCDEEWMCRFNTN